jgi:hypothetical protein
MGDLRDYLSSPHPALRAPLSRFSITIKITTYTTKRWWSGRGARGEAIREKPPLSYSVIMHYYNKKVNTLRALFLLAL